MEFWQNPVPIAVPPDPAMKGISYRILLYLKNFSNYDNETSSRLAKKIIVRTNARVPELSQVVQTALPVPRDGGANASPPRSSLRCRGANEVSLRMYSQR